LRFLPCRSGSGRHRPGFLRDQCLEDASRGRPHRREDRSGPARRRVLRLAARALHLGSAPPGNVSAPERGPARAARAERAARALARRGAAGLRLFGQALQDWASVRARPRCPRFHRQGSARSCPRGAQIGAKNCAMLVLPVPIADPKSSKTENFFLARKFRYLISSPPEEEGALDRGRRCFMTATRGRTSVRSAVIRPAHRRAARSRLSNEPRSVCRRRVRRLHQFGGAGAGSAGAACASSAASQRRLLAAGRRLRAAEALPAHVRADDTFGPHTRGGAVPASRGRCRELRLFPDHGGADRGGRGRVLGGPRESGVPPSLQGLSGSAFVRRLERRSRARRPAPFVVGALCKSDCFAAERGDAVSPGSFFP
jgi:hypothetical protein